MIFEVTMAFDGQNWIIACLDPGQEGLSGTGADLTAAAQDFMSKAAANLPGPTQIQLVFA